MPVSMCVACVVLEFVTVRMIVRHLVVDSSTRTVVVTTASLVVMFAISFKVLADAWVVLRRAMRALWADEWAAQIQAERDDAGKIS